MKANDSDLRRMFVQATDEVVPPAPWLEAQVVNVLQRGGRARRQTFDLGPLGGFVPSLRLAAALLALLIVVASVAAVLMNARLHLPTVPGSRSTINHTPSQDGIIPFTPSPAVRAMDWPPGGPIPAQMAGSWRQSSSAPILHLGGYTFQLGEETQGPNLDARAFGNVVVNGNEIDFISSVCSRSGGFGYERFTYTLTADVLVIRRSPGPGQSNCMGYNGIPLPPLGGTYSRVS